MYPSGMRGKERMCVYVCGGGVCTAYVLHACLHMEAVCMCGAYSECWECVCVCIGGCLKHAGALGGGFGYLDKGLCLYLYAIPKK